MISPHRITLQKQKRAWLRDSIPHLPVPDFSTRISTDSDFLYLLQSSPLKVQVGFLPLRKTIVKVWTVLFISAYLTACAAPGPEKFQTIMDSVTAEKVHQIISSDVIPSSGGNHGDVISRVSSAFLGTAYQADTLIGGPGTPEALVVNFNGVDCFTLADYVEALTRSHDQKSFLHNLAEVRYTGGNVDYLSRRHFFSDWFATAPRNARDVTPDISHDYLVAGTNSLTVRRTGGSTSQGWAFILVK